MLCFWTLSFSGFLRICDIFFHRCEHLRSLELRQRFLLSLLVELDVLHNTGSKELETPERKRSVSAISSLQPVTRSFHVYEQKCVRVNTGVSIAATSCPSCLWPQPFFKMLNMKCFNLLSITEQRTWQGDCHGDSTLTVHYDSEVSRLWSDETCFWQTLCHWYPCTLLQAMSRTHFVPNILVSTCYILYFKYRRWMHQITTMVIFAALLWSGEIWIV